MANKNLTDLTARTATADSDLIHVNSGGTDYKETKANFLSNITSSISSINSSLANIGTRNVTYYASNAIAATFSYTGVSFTITKKSIVRADLYYTYSSPQEIAICGSASGNQIIYAHGTAVSGITNTCIGCTALLAPGTYYIWARSGSAANNSIGVTGYQIEP